MAPRDSQARGGGVRPRGTERPLLTIRETMDQATNQSTRNGEQDAWRAAWRDAMRTTSLGWDLALPICGGALLGHSLDRRYQTGWVPTLALLFVGVTIGYVNVIRQLRSEIVRDATQPSPRCARRDATQRKGDESA